MQWLKRLIVAVCEKVNKKKPLRNDKWKECEDLCLQKKIMTEENTWCVKKSEEEEEEEEEREVNNNNNEDQIL